MTKDFDLLVVAKVDLWGHVWIGLGQKDDVATLFAVAALGHKAHGLGLRHEFFHAQISGGCAAFGVQIEDGQHQIAKGVKCGVLHDHAPIITTRWGLVLVEAVAIDQGCFFGISRHALCAFVEGYLGKAAIGFGLDFEAAKERIRANAGD